MFLLGTHAPLIGETISIPTLDLTGKASQRFASLQVRLVSKSLQVEHILLRGRGCLHPISVVHRLFEKVLATHVDDKVLNFDTFS